MGGYLVFCAFEGLVIYAHKSETADIELLEKVVNFGKTCKDLTVDSVRSFRFLLVYGDELFVIFQ